jgi:hypothetical protein
VDQVAQGGDDQDAEGGAKRKNKMKRKEKPIDLDFKEFKEMKYIMVIILT